jgi:hypothetical protein
MRSTQSFTQSGPDCQHPCLTRADAAADVYQSRSVWRRMCQARNTLMAQLTPPGVVPMLLTPCRGPCWARQRRLGKARWPPRGRDQSGQATPSWQNLQDRRALGCPEPTLAPDSADPNRVGAGGKARTEAGPFGLQDGPLQALAWSQRSVAQTD